MTFQEKSIVISALAEYAKRKKIEAEKQSKKGEAGRAANARKEACMASGLMQTFATILSDPAGSVKI